MAQSAEAEVPGPRTESHPNSPAASEGDEALAFAPHVSSEPRDEPSPRETAADLPSPVPSQDTNGPTAQSPAEPDAEAEEAPSPFSYLVFADAYAGVSTNLAGTGRSPGPTFAFAPENGVGLAFAGADLRYNTRYFGASVDVRAGSAVPVLLGSDLTVLGAVGLKQAFISLRPVPALRIDAGQFDTIYGAEVSESWLNANYTRGALYFVAQPFFHTGLRVNAELPGGIELRALAVQGWNSVIDNNEGKSFGAQFAWSGENASVSAGYIGGPEQASMVEQARMPGVNGRWRHLVDVVAQLKAGPVSFLVNADYIREEVSGGSFSQAYGGMLTLRYGFAPFAIALRAEVLNDADGLFLGVPDMVLGTGTATFEVTPVEGVVLRLDARYDAASDAVFATGADGFSNDAFRVVLGAVVHSGQ
ncbi:MAG: outer membrane beta-barrel protein [Polyangiales bacterium]